MPHSAVDRPRGRTFPVDVLGRSRGAITAGLAGALLATAPAAAMEPTGGTAPVMRPAPTAPAVTPAPTAGSYGSGAPRLSRVACRSACGAGGTVRPGSVVRVGGRNLRAVTEVIFLGAAGDADDASVAPRSTRRRALLARVPRTARSGAVAVALPDGTRSPATATAVTVDPLPLAPPAGVVDAEVQERKVFYGSRRPAELSYVVGGSEPATVEVELVRADDYAPVQTWSPGVVAAGEPQTIRWAGLAAGAVAPDGVYQFRVTATGSSGVRATSSRAGAVDPAEPGAFTFLRHRFPIAGTHDYGEHAASFGGGRGHQGHDVFAACGTPIVAARGGVVQFKQYHSRAGHYLVIDGARTGIDFVYMHLRDAALVDAGDRVRTGQAIGFVGATGRASGCHLHFEEWTAPGWYSGGSPIDPLPDLKAWDAHS